MEQMGGKVYVKSVQGDGAEFIIKLTTKCKQKVNYKMLES